MNQAFRLDEARFCELFARCGPAATTAARQCFRELERRYAESARRYHTAEHINHCLAELDAARRFIDDPDAVEMALWFHDAVYVPGDRANERKAAEFFLDLSGNRFDQRFRDMVCDLILITQHREVPSTLNEAFVVDIDLSSFGVPWPKFLAQSSAVRAEMLHQSDEDFALGQCRFLASLLERPRFFFTDFFEQRLGVAARANAERFVSRLRMELALLNAA